MCFYRPMRRSSEKMNVNFLCACCVFPVQKSNLFDKYHEYRLFDFDNSSV
jgi:hypothetical protein